MSMLTQFWLVCKHDQSLIKLDSNHILKLFSNILQSSLIGFAFQFRRCCCKLVQVVQNSLWNQALKHIQIILKTSLVSRLKHAQRYTILFAKGIAQMLQSHCHLNYCSFHQRQRTFNSACVDSIYTIFVCKQGCRSASCLHEFKVIQYTSLAESELFFSGSGQNSRK